MFLSELYHISFYNFSIFMKTWRNQKQGYRMAENLTSSRVLLRAAQESDLDAFYAIRANNDAMKFWYDITHLYPHYKMIYMAGF